jgi:nucleotide-binding universal stress UspA family protein
MQNSTALFCVDTETPDSVIKAAAEAAEARNTHLAVVLFGAVPTLPMNIYGALPYGSIAVPDDWPDILNAARTKLRDRTDAVEAVLAAAGASADVRPLFSPHADIMDGVAQSALTSDVALFAPNLREDSAVFKEMLHGVLFRSPIGAILNDNAKWSFERVLLAWNDGLASSRAAHAALPLLRHAKDVQIVCYDPPGSQAGSDVEPGREVAAWLSHHGCEVTLSQLPSGGKEIGACILDRAGETGADLIVAGAYGHSRMRQAVFGGTSRTLIEQNDVPVFLAH